MECTRSRCLYAGRGSCRHQSGVVFGDCARMEGAATVNASRAIAMKFRTFALCTDPRIDMNWRVSRKLLGNPSPQRDILGGPEKFLCLCETDSSFLPGFWLLYPVCACWPRYNSHAAVDLGATLLVRLRRLLLRGSSALLMWFWWWRRIIATPK